MKTRVFLSVKTLLAFSVFNGLTKTEYLSNLEGNFMADVERAYLGFDATRRVAGRKNLSLVLI